LGRLALARMFHVEHWKRFKAALGTQYGVIVTATRCQLDKCFI